MTSCGCWHESGPKVHNPVRNPGLDGEGRAGGQDMLACSFEQKTFDLLEGPSKRVLVSAAPALNAIGSCSVALLRRLRGVKSGLRRMTGGNGA